MSLVRQAILLVVSALLLTLGTSALIGLRHSHDALRTGLQLRNADVAAMLAVALSSQRGDAAAMAQDAAKYFEVGQLRRLSLRAPDGTLIFDRESPPANGNATAAPGWFVAALPIAPAPGFGTVGDSANPFARIELESDPATLHAALWAGLLRNLAWWLALSLLAAGAVAVVVWHRVGGLERLMAQAQALQEGRFVEVDEPPSGELRRLAAGMNAAVRRLRALFDSHAGQLETLRVQAQIDATTGTSNRRHFVAQLEHALVANAGAAAEPEGPRRGALLIVRLHNLEAMNRRVGHDTVDRLLASVGEVLLAYPQRVEGAFAGRLNGADLALYLPVNGVARESAEALRATLAASLGAVDPGARLAIGGVEHLATGNVSDALARADEALARAESIGGFAVEVIDADEGEAIGEGEWRQRIADALDGGRVDLAEFPVVDPRGRTLHLECPLRLQWSAPGRFSAAAQWLPMAARGRQTQKVDLAAAELALQAIARDGRARCVSVAAASLVDPAFVHAMTRLLAATVAPTRMLSIEVGAAVAARGRVWRHAAQCWRPFGVRLGIEDVGGTMHTLADARGWGLDYLKVDGRFVRGLAKDRSLAQYARQIVAMAQGLDIEVYAGGIDDADDLQQLWEIGFDGATGPAVAARR
jgi:predicted signal transduction protein with EAL and GGDEF domain